MQKIFFIFFILTQYANADITGIGYASTKYEAKKEALADLAGNIKSEVRSNFESIQTDTGSTSKSNIKVSANLPILGFESFLLKNKKDVQIRVSLSSSKASKLYLHELKKISKEINNLLKEIIEEKSSSLKLNLYGKIYSLLSEYDRYESVAVILDTTLPKRPKITKVEVNSKTAKLYSKIDTLEMAANVFAKNFTQKEIFVYAPRVQNYTTISEFGAVFLQELQGKLNTTKTLQNAKFILVGEYVVTEKRMVLNYSLLDVKMKKIIHSKTININKKAYKDLHTQPKNQNFDALINSGVITSSNLKVSLKSNKGSEGLLFKAEEEVELFIKLNKMGYIYIVGYTQTSEENFSYLLELNEGHGDSKFKMFINADDSNRWLSLGAFTIKPPFGVESLQVIASNRPIKRVPNVKYDVDTEYYIVSKDIKKALTNTRGLHKNKAKKEISEDVLSFTTIK